jgi:predicted DNA-binding ribbon-helix-helix protein
MTTLQNRNIHLNGQRTSLRLEPTMWEALEEICRRERRSISDICAFIESQRGASSRTAAVRVFILRYFRAAATESGHSAAGHGQPRKFVHRNAVLANPCTPLARPRGRRGMGLPS